MEDKDILQAALAKAITEAVSPEVRKEVFQKAMTNYLFRAAGDTPRSVITDAFQRALDDATREMARAVVAEPENQKRIRETIQKALEMALDTRALQERLAEKFVKSINGY
jgi:hypothetical protein